MRYIDGQQYATVSEAAEAAGVSPQTVRIWENLGRVSSRRSPGGHRLFDMNSVKALVEQAAQMRRDERSNRTPVAVQPNLQAAEFAATGARIRELRERQHLTQEQVATRAQISRSLLSAVERGESGVSVQVFNRIAEALGMPPSDLAPMSPGRRAVIRKADRPRTVLASGVTWEELASSGHSMAPAVLIVAPGGSSGGTSTSSRGSFVTILEGQLTINVAAPTEQHVLGAGDSLMINAGQKHDWANHGRRVVRGIWVEQLDI